MVSKAHLDPAWQWRWTEGLAEAISTFRVAADFCEEFDGYIFTHNEAVLYEWVEENKLKMHHWFFTTDLTFFVKGGRVSKAAGWFGTVFQICPLLNVSNEGKLIPREKIRTKAKVIDAIVNKMVENADGGAEYSGKCYISHSGRFSDAQLVADKIRDLFPNLDGKVIINNIGTTIGSHTGPGTVALFFWGDKREN